MSGPTPQSSRTRVAAAQAETLQALQRDLRDVVTPEVSSDSARTTLAMAIELLGWVSIGLRGEDDRSAANVLSDASDDDIAGYDAGSELLGSDDFLRHAAARARSVRTASAGSPRIREAVAAEAARLAAEDAAAAALDSGGAAPDQPLDRDRLAGWMAAQPGLAELRIEQLERVLGGYSKDTWLIDAEEGGARRSLVLRRDLPFGPGENSVVDEFAVLDALQRYGVAAPPPIAIERTGAVAGTPFILFPRLAGRAVFGDWTAPAEERAAIACEVARTMARYHGLEPAALGLPTVSRQAAVAAMIAEWRAKWERRRLYPSAILEAAFGWLAANVPAGDGSARLIHGDVTFRNTLIEDGRLIALLDWEFQHLGDPIEDLSYFELVAAPVTDWQAVLAAYRAAGGDGYDPERARFYSVWRSTRNAVTTATAWHGFVRGLYPVSKAAYQGFSLHRFFLRDVAAKLEEVM